MTSRDGNISCHFIIHANHKRKGNLKQGGISRLTVAWERGHPSLGDFSLGMVRGSSHILPKAKRYQVNRKRQGEGKTLRRVPGNDFHP